MKKISIFDIAKAVSAKNVPKTEAMISDISTDSRMVGPQSVFVAIKGERVDGHDYIKSALEKGAAYAIADRETDYKDDRILMVENAFEAPMQIAKYYLGLFNVKTVAVTGSVGKTTTKEFVAAVLACKYKTLKSEGNHNNEIGLPRTVFKLDESFETAVFEMGMSALGDITKLTNIVKPAAAVITNIGISHLEHLGTRENILKAKMEVTDGMPEGAPLFLCGDNDLLRTVSGLKQRVVFYGLEPHNQITAKDIAENENTTSFTICAGGECFAAKIPTIGVHNVCNALAAFGVGVEYGIAPAEIVAALESYRPSGMRQNIVKKHGVTFAEDCYNASPDSMKAALDTFKNMAVQGKKIAVLGDMLELGDDTVNLHTNVGRWVKENEINMLFASGPLAENYAKGALSAGMPPQNVFYFKNKEELTKKLMETVKKGDALWFKASRGMEFETIIDALYERGEDFGS